MAFRTVPRGTHGGRGQGRRALQTRLINADNCSINDVVMKLMSALKWERLSSPPRGRLRIADEPSRAGIVGLASAGLISREVKCVTDRPLYSSL